jgi:hypothetical protein
MAAFPRQEWHVAADTEGMESVLRCWHCGDVIGVYEPMMIVEDGEVRETSRLLERAGGPEWARAADCYHESCFAIAYERAHRPRVHRPGRRRGSTARDASAHPAAAGSRPGARTPA